MLDMVVPWGKSPAEHQLTAGASFKTVTSMQKNESHRLKNLFQRGPTHLKNLPIIMIVRLREVDK